jgi:predicted transcriptional regulator
MDLPKGQGRPASIVILIDSGRTVMPKRPPSIPDSELDVLRVLWDRGQGTVREILETLQASGRTWSYATVATLLDRLETKGMVASDRRELAFVYRPTISAHEVRRVENLVEKLYQGEPGLLVLHLLKSHPLDADQAQQVRALLDEMTGKTAKKTRS